MIKNILDGKILQICYENSTFMCGKSSVIECRFKEACIALLQVESSCSSSRRRNHCRRKSIQATD